jgi:hypothetical protein
MEILDQYETTSPMFAGEIVLRARLALWFPELLEGMKNAEVPANAPISSPWAVVRFVRDVANGNPLDPQLDAFTQFVEYGNHATRFQSVVRQLLAEFLTYAGRTDDAFAQIDGSIKMGLFDLTWADRCPAIAKLRSDPRFIQVRAVIAERAQSVRHALEI